MWFTGLPCSGKSTLATRTAELLKERGLKVERLDGDVMRAGLSKDLGFSKRDRDINIDRVIAVAEILNRNGICVVASFVSPYRAKRQEVRDTLKNFVEIHVDCPLEECERRDTKGMYRRARAGEIENFTGVSDPYEEPEHPEVTVHTDRDDIHDSLAKILTAVDGRIPGPIVDPD